MLIPDGWAELPVLMGGKQIASVWVQGSEVHCLRLDEVQGRWMTHQNIERILGPILKQHGYLTTKVRRSNQTGHRFVTRLGFVATHDDELNTYYKAERLKHARL